ncbi:MAG TPA: hypothetical protein VHE30_19155 [Polyangiaceae bacterium]|nr:hypothetical protein [Polyangiaceae bacterium]
MHPGRSEKARVRELHLVLSGVLLVAALPGCRHVEPNDDRLPDVDRCTLGVRKARSERTLSAALRTYYTECSALYLEPACRDAFVAAGSAPQADQLRVVAEGCRKAYCPVFSGRGFELCSGTGELSTEAALHGWPPLHEAILARDTKDYAPYLTHVMLRFYRQVATWPAEGAPASAGAPGEAPPTSAPVPSGSAAPAPSASTAR